MEPDPIGIEDSMINVRTSQGNRTRSVDDADVQRRIVSTVEKLVR